MKTLKQTDLELIREEIKNINFKNKDCLFIDLKIKNHKPCLQIKFADMRSKFAMRLLFHQQPDQEKGVESCFFDLNSTCFIQFSDLEHVSDFLEQSKIYLNN